MEEDLIILEKRLKIGNKWSEIIKEMQGRTENNVKNRFNMMYKLIKDEKTKNLLHQSVFAIHERTLIDESINEEELISELI